MAPRKAKPKQFQLVVHQTSPKGRLFHTNDLGPLASPRFELYDDSLSQVLKKSDNPLDFDKYIEKE